ncbi:MAG: CopD family protein [Thiobacillaceae bacterium]|jgi:putative membrane protein|nr:CopD family protein [Thiobacillaceae bacterium]
MLWLKSFHIVMVISWFAGLFYLPRIFVNLAMEKNDAAYDRLLLMAGKLYRFVSPIMWLTLITGFWLWFAYWLPTDAWLWVKVVLVFGLVGYHHVCKSLLRKFQARQNDKSHVWFRWFNEIPVIVLLVVVLLVVLKPF